MRALDRANDATAARFVATAEAHEATGAVVVVDVLRAFSTAAYALASGAAQIYLVGSVAEALAFKADHPGTLAMGEEHGRRPAGFDFANSPVELGSADMAGRTIVQRTSAGTQGVVAALAAERLWCAALVIASATARAVLDAGLGAPTYIITGWGSGSPGGGVDDLATAELIERARLGLPLDAAATAARVTSSEEAIRTLSIGEGHVHPEDVDRSVAVDAFDFAMEVTRTPLGLRLERVNLAALDPEEAPSG
jgi:2-phosphosulfolactate phosphatase